MFSFGNAMSMVPIWSGMTKLPKAAKPSGTMPKNTMTVPCMAPSMLYNSPFSEPSAFSQRPNICSKRSPIRGRWRITSTAGTGMPG